MSESLSPTRAAELLHRQATLQAEAAQIIAALDLPALLARAGRVEQIGSSISGLMVWRDLDFNIVAPGLTPEGLADTIRPLLTNPQTIDLHYQQEIGPRSPSGTPHDDRYYVVLHHLTADSHDWKIDLSFWLADAPRAQLAHLTYLKERLTPELRLTIPPQRPLAPPTKLPLHHRRLRHLRRRPRTPRPHPHRLRRLPPRPRPPGRLTHAAPSRHHIKVPRSRGI